MTIVQKHMFMICFGFLAICSTGCVNEGTAATRTAETACSVSWKSDLHSALREVRSTKKPVLLVLGATWCGPCSEMKRNVWPSAPVCKAVKGNFVPIYVDVDDPKQSDVVRRFGVDTIPAVFILDAEGRVVRQESYMDQAQTLDFLRLTR